jgi:hypothetical protein
VQRVHAEMSDAMVCVIRRLSTAEMAAMVEASAHSCLGHQASEISVTLTRRMTSFHSSRHFARSSKATWRGCNLV